MNKYILKIDVDNNILSVLNTFDYNDNDIELTESEYLNALRYNKFDPNTRLFSELRHGSKSELDELITSTISKSKILLEKWLEENPLFSTVHNTAGEYYTVTQEKQTQLTQMITLATLAAQTGIPFIPTWNSTSNVCEEWTIEELTALTFEITRYVLPRVKKQQDYEVQIREATTKEEVESIEIDYTTI